MVSESRITDKSFRNMLSVALNELFGSVCFLSLGCSWFCNMGMLHGLLHGMQILRMDGGFKVICDQMEDHRVMKCLAIQSGKHNALHNGVMLPLQYQLASCEMKPHGVFAISLSKSEGVLMITWKNGCLKLFEPIWACGTMSVTWPRVSWLMSWTRRLLWESCSWG